MSDKRAPNFSISEETLLLRIVNSHREIIESKITNASTNEKKKKEWAIISGEFNSQNVGINRDPGVLKRKYENIKRDVKKKLGDEKRNKVVTDVGTILTVHLDEDEEQLVSLMSPQATGLPNVDGDDGNDNDLEMNPGGSPRSEASTSSPQLRSAVVKPLSSSALPSSHHEDVLDEPPRKKTAQVVLDASDPSPLRRSCHPALKTHKRPSREDKFSRWADSKTGYVEEEEKRQAEKHAACMAHMEEEHKMKTSLMKLQQEEQELKVKLLQLQLAHSEQKHAWLKEEHLLKMAHLREGKLDSSKK